MNGFDFCYSITSLKNRAKTEESKKSSWYCCRPSLWFNFVSQDGKGKRNFLKDVNKNIKKLFYKQRRNNRNTYSRGIRRSLQALSPFAINQYIQASKRIREKTKHN